jgi:hypothetical protein
MLMQSCWVVEYFDVIMSSIQLNVQH